MPIEDAYRWDQRYQQGQQADFQLTRRFLVENQRFLPSSGLALDIAMGTGRNAAFLIENGLEVVGVDISAVAVRQAKQHSTGIMAIIGDLTQLSFPDRVFDVIINFYYLQRDLWADYRRMLRPGGVLFLETLTVGMLAIKPDTHAEFLLQPDELRQAFQDWNILVYQEGVVPSDHNQSKAVASLVARLPDD
jgi:SAM-dependent methyltransferase